MTAAVVLSALLFWCAVFTIFFATQGTNPLEFFLGRYEPLPADLGQWRQLGRDPQTGLLREERLLLPSGRPNAARFVHQVRLRDPLTREILRVEPERHVRRRRVSAR